MEGYQKLSPVRLPGTIETRIQRDGWEIALSYNQEDSPLTIIDLSHFSKWEIYDPELPGQSLGPLHVPNRTGEVVLTAEIIVGLCRPSVALVFKCDHSGDELLSEANYADVTDGYALLALIGDDGPLAMEKITDLDLTSRSRQHAHLVQGPLLDAPSKIMVFSTAGCKTGMLIAVDRGSGQSIVDAIVDAGTEFELKSAGERAFNRWLGFFIQTDKIDGN
jgi:hypothetical protein